MNRQGAKAAKDAKEGGLEEPSAAADWLARVVIGAAIDVHRALGPGFLESVYEEALCVELALRRVPFARQVPIEVQYKGRTVGQLRIDLLVDASLVVEIKAVEELAPIHLAQTLSYLSATRLRLGLLITFNVHLLRQGIRRVIRTP